MDGLWVLLKVAVGGIEFSAPYHTVQIFGSYEVTRKREFDARWVLLEDSRRGIETSAPYHHVQYGAS